MSDKIKVVAYCDSPTCATGFGTVSRNILEALHNTGRYEIEILGINYWGDPHDLPYKIWPVGINGDKDPYGRQWAINKIATMDFDVLFFLQDSFTLNFLPALLDPLKDVRKQQNKPFKSICYYPVDSVIKEGWAKNIESCDYLVAYCKYGRDQSIKHFPDRKIDIIYHGVNLSDYYPLPEDEVIEFRKAYFGDYSDRFIITNVNRNQQRKDIPRCLMAFKHFQKIVPNSILYLHMKNADDVGWDFAPVCESLGLTPFQDVFMPTDFGPNAGYPREVLNQLYNASDVIVSTTLGEGWGLSWSEAMATKTPVVMPDNTTMHELITKDRGYLVKSGSNPNLFTILRHDNEVLRPIIDIEDMIDTLLNVYNNRDEAKEKAENAYQWILEELDWNQVTPQWVNLFDKAYNSLEDSVVEEEILTV